jgi:hypothetical protein
MVTRVMVLPQLLLSGTTENYGVLASAYGINSFSGYFNGANLNVGGTIYPSDSILKTKVKNIKNAITTINKLKPKSFYFDTANTIGLNFSPMGSYPPVDYLLPPMDAS